MSERVGAVCELRPFFVSIASVYARGFAPFFLLGKEDGEFVGKILVNFVRFRDGTGTERARDFYSFRRSRRDEESGVASTDVGVRFNRAFFHSDAVLRRSFFKVFGEANRVFCRGRRELGCDGRVRPFLDVLHKRRSPFLKRRGREVPDKSRSSHEILPRNDHFGLVGESRDVF